MIPLYKRETSVHSFAMESIVESHLLAFVANVFPQPDGLHSCVAVVAQRPILIANKAAVGQFLRAHLAAEALRMPIRCHRLDDATDHELAALVAARSEKYVKIAFAILAPLELVENAILEGAEALSAPTETNCVISIGVSCVERSFHLHEALGVPQLAVRIDDFLVRLEALLAAGAKHIAQRHIRGHYAAPNERLSTR